MTQDLKKALANWVNNKIDNAEKSYNLKKDFVIGAEVCLLKITSNFEVSRSEFITITSEKIFPLFEQTKNGQKWGDDVYLFKKEVEKIDFLFEEIKKKAIEIWS